MANEKRLIVAGDLWSDIMMLPHNGDMISSEEVEQAIMEAPTVDAVEVVHGTWENEQFGFMYYNATCSVCKSHNDSASNYCPHCGAKMDGGSNG